jgi:hypothetical protein
MADPQQTTPIPTDNQKTPQTPNQETDFFGGGDAAFADGVITPEWGVPVVGSTPFVPEEPVWEPTIPAEPTESWELKPTAVESWEVKIEKIAPIVEPVIEPIPEPTVPEVATPVEEVEQHIPTPVAEPITEEEKEPVAEPKALSDLGKKFTELTSLCRQIYEWKKTDEGFQLIWADNDKLQTLYKFVLGDEAFPMVSVSKVETDKATQEEIIHELSFYLNEAGTALDINLDEELLFEEEVDLQNDLKTKMQVMEKLNKFIFLVTEESKKIEKEIKAKEAEQAEKRKLQDVFRNF